MSHWIMELAVEESILVGVELAEIDSHFCNADLEGRFRLPIRALHARPPTVDGRYRCISSSHGLSERSEQSHFGGANIGVQAVSRTGEVPAAGAARPACGRAACDDGPGSSTAVPSRVITSSC